MVSLYRWYILSTENDYIQNFYIEEGFLKNLENTIMRSTEYSTTFSDREDMKE